jgi:hypothetical protein
MAATPTDDTRSEQCLHCRYWQPLEANPSQGGCHRWAPRASTEEPLHPTVSWPVTDRHDWCGEFRDRALPRPQGS